MKRDFFAIIIFAIILGVGIYENVFFNKTIDVLNSYNNELEQQIKNFDNEKSIEVCNKMVDYWEDNRLLLESVFYNPNIYNVGYDINEMLGALKLKDDKSAMAKVYVFRKRLQTLKETTSLSVFSII